MCPFHTATDACSSGTMFIRVGFLQICFIHIHEQESPLFREGHGGFSKKSELDLPRVNKQETQRVGAWPPIQTFKTAALSCANKPTLYLCVADAQRGPQGLREPRGRTSARPAWWWLHLSLTRPSNCCCCPRSKQHDFACRLQPQMCHRKSVEASLPGGGAWNRPTGSWSGPRKGLTGGKRGRNRHQVRMRFRRGGKCRYHTLQ